MKKTMTGAKAFFSEDGRRYFLRDVHFMPAADSFLFNDLMFLQMDHRGRTGGTYGGSESPFFLQPNHTRYSEDLRCAYVRDDDTGDHWSSPYDPVQVEPDEFEFSPGIGDITWRNVTDRIAVDMRLFVPADETVEVWTVTVTNVSRRRRKVSVYPFFPMGCRSWLINKCRWEEKAGAFVYDLFPYYVTVEDYYNNLKLKNVIFCAADRKPTSYTADLDEFKGEGGLHNPDELSAKRLSRRYANFKSGAAVFQYALNLAPGKSATMNFVFGPARDTRDIRRLKRKFLTKGGIERALAKVEKYYKKPSVRIETPDVEFNHFVNHWMPKQALWMGRTLRSSFCPCARNAMTDTTGILYTDPQRARYWIKRIWSLQHENGWIEHGLPFAEGVHMSLINTVPHRDMNAWGPMFVYYYLCETGDTALLDEVVPFVDDDKGATLYEHLCTGLNWQLKDRSKRGLSLLGQGDWCDPLNMAGHRGKGESVMLTQLLIYSLSLWADVAEHRGDRARAGRYRREAEECRRAVNKYAWDGQWYVRGFTDAGKPFGSRKNREGKIWCNAQNWAIISGAATGGRLARSVKAVERYLVEPSGAAMLGPAYTPFHEDIGKVTIKNPGIDENGAVYNSASCWWAFALLWAKMPDKGWKATRVMLPGGKGNTNTLERAKQLPLYIPNFYKGEAVGRDAGESSRYPSTGTISWYYYMVIGYLMGVRGELGGLRIDPQIPSHWKKARVWRRWRGADFDIEIARSRKVNKTEVTLDGARLPDNLVPIQKKGTKHKVEVTIP